MCPLGLPGVRTDSRYQGELRARYVHGRWGNAMLRIESGAVAPLRAGAASAPWRPPPPPPGRSGLPHTKKTQDPRPCSFGGCSQPPTWGKGTQRRARGRVTKRCTSAVRSFPRPCAFWGKVIADWGRGPWAGPPGSLSGRGRTRGVSDSAAGRASAPGRYTPQKGWGRVRGEGGGRGSASSRLR